MVNKALGQHWLYNRAILDEIADLAVGEGVSGDFDAKNGPQGDFDAENGPQGDFDAKNGPQGRLEGRRWVVLEIGPGLGTLTASLLKRFEKVVAVEFDPKLARNLPKSFPGTNLEVKNADILKFDLTEMDEGYVVAGNIPYYITSPILKTVLTTKNLPARVVLLMQKEVAERVAMERESVLSLFVKNRAAVTLGPVVLKEEFEPAPKVDSQVLILEPFRTGPKYKDELFTLINRAFRAPRKKLVHNLAGAKSKEELLAILAKIGVDKNARPSDLHLDDYQRLSEEL